MKDNQNGQAQYVLETKDYFGERLYYTGNSLLADDAQKAERYPLDAALEKSRRLNASGSRHYRCVRVQ